MISNAAEHIGKPGLRINAVEFGGLDEGVGNGHGLSSALGTGKHPVFTADGYLSAEKDGEWLTLSDAASKLGVSHHQVRKLINAGILTSNQIMPDAPHQIRAADLDSDQVAAALARKGRPCRVTAENQISMFPDT